MDTQRRDGRSHDIVQMIATGGLCRRALRGSTPLITHNLYYVMRACPSSRRFIYFKKLSSISAHGRGEYFLLLHLEMEDSL